MKKAILITLALLISASLYAQYRGTYWGETAPELLKDKKLESGKNRSYYISEYEETARMMGEATKVRYFTLLAKLKYIGYTIDWTEDREKQLIKNLDTGLFKIEYIKKLEPFYTKEEYETLTEEEKIQLKSLNKENITYILVEDLYVFSTGAGQAVMEDLLNVESKPEEKACIIKAKYGANTDIYVFSNIFLGNITVIYTEAVQDF